MLYTLNRKVADINVNTQPTDRIVVLYFNEVMPPPDPEAPLPPMGMNAGYITQPMTEADSEAYVIGNQYEMGLTPVAPAE